MGMGNGVVSLPLIMKAKDHFPINDRPYNELEALRFNPITINPAPEVEVLRFNRKKVVHLEVEANEEKVLRGIKGKAIEIKSKMNIHDAR